MRYQVRMHPTLDILVSSIGGVFVPATKGHKAHWTYGCKKNHGYLMVGISRKQYLAHRIVAETFLPNPNNHTTVDHINRNPLDNKVENLRWADRKMQADNTIHVHRALEKYGVRECEDRNAYQRARYANDPEFAERVRECSHEYKRKHRSNENNR